MRQPRRGAGDAGQTCRGGGGADGQIPRRRRSGVRQEERVTNRRRLSKGKPAIWGPGFPPSTPALLTAAPHPPPPQAPGRPFCRPERVQVASCAAARPGQGQTALLLPGDGVPQPVASPRLRGRGGGGGGARRRRPRRLLTLPGNRGGAAGQRRPTVRFLKGAGTFLDLAPAPRRD